MTALDQNFSDLANILMQRRQMQAQQIQQDRANRLSDLQFKQLQREDDYQTGLRDVMSNPGGSGVTLPQLQPQPQQNTLASLAPGNRLPFTQPQASFAPVEAKLSPSRAGADYALSQGRIEDAVKLFTVDDQLAQLQAKGDLSGYYEAKQELDMNKQFFEAVKTTKSIPGGLKQMWPQLQRMFPDQTAGITPDSIQTNGRLVLAPLEMDGQVIPNRGVYYDEDGKQHIVDTTPKADPEAMMDKRFQQQEEMQTRRESAADRRTQQQIDAADRRAATAAANKDRAPGKILPAGQLESVADMKRVKDVLAEASDLLKSGKVDTGPVSGRLQSLRSIMGLASDDFVNLQQKMQTAENIMLKLRSGAAVTESEYQRFKKEFPRTSDTPAVRDRKMSNAIKYASTLMDSKMDIYEEGGYRVPKSVKSGGQRSAAEPANRGSNKPITTKGGFKVTRVP